MGVFLSLGKPFGSAKTKDPAGILRGGFAKRPSRTPPRTARRAFTWARPSAGGAHDAATRGARSPLAWVSQVDGDARVSSARIGDRMLLIVLVVLLVLSIGGGGWGHSRYGYAGWSPAGVILLVLAVLFFTGHL